MIRRQKLSQARETKPEIKNSKPWEEENGSFTFRSTAHSQFMANEPTQSRLLTEPQPTTKVPPIRLSGHIRKQLIRQPLPKTHSAMSFYNHLKKLNGASNNSSAYLRPQRLSDKDSLYRPIT